MFEKIVELDGCWFTVGANESDGEYEMVSIRPMIRGKLESLEDSGIEMIQFFDKQGIIDSISDLAMAKFGRA